MSLEPSVYEVQQYLSEQISKIARIPTDPRFQLTNKASVKIMFQQMVNLSAQYLPEAFANVQRLCDNLRQLQQFFEKNCGIVGLAMQRDP